MTAPRRVYMDLSRPGPGRCGICGEWRDLSRSHVPPQAAGNSGSGVTRAQMIEGERGVRVGRATGGGLWVRGLCGPCNSLAGGRYDRAYADFARRCLPYAGAGRRLSVRSGDAPAVTLAPGLVARAVLYGMHAVSPALRRSFPRLASSLAAGDAAVRLPDGVGLRLALTPWPTARIAGPIHAYRVLESRLSYVTHAEVFFPPFAWALTTPTDERSVFDAQGWADARDWPLYSADRTAVDLRHLVGALPLVRHPLHTDRDNWLELTSDKVTPLVEGRLSVS